MEIAEGTHSYRILLVDYEKAITTHLGPFLERAGFEVMIAGDGEAALRLVDEVRPDLVVLDVLMPHLDGRETLRRLRRAGNWTSVILLTQVGSPVERAVALDEGADDYLDKPFEPYELVARIRAVLRRSRAGGPSLAGARRLRSGPLELDRQARGVLLQGRELPLTAKAISVLEYMVFHPDEVLTRERLLDAVWGWDYAAATRAADTRVADAPRLGRRPGRPQVHRDSHRPGLSLHPRRGGGHVRRYLAALLALALGLLLAVAWQSGLWPNFILHLRADAGTLLALLGALANQGSREAALGWPWCELS